MTDDELDERIRQVVAAIAEIGQTLDDDADEDDEEPRKLKTFN